MWSREAEALLAAALPMCERGICDSCRYGGEESFQVQRLFPALPLQTLGVWVDGKLTISPLCALTAKRIWFCGSVQFPCRKTEFLTSLDFYEIPHSPMVFCACLFCDSAFASLFLCGHDKKSLAFHVIETQFCQTTMQGTRATNRQTHKQISYRILKICYLFLQKQSREDKCKH